MSKKVSGTTVFSLNGSQVAVSPVSGERLSATLREQLDCRDVKIGCEAGDCGSCTVLIDGDVICACLTPTRRVAGKKVETLAGLTEGDDLAKALGNSFQNFGAAQCGFCTPGMMAAALALLRENSTPDAEQVEDALNGVLCRCTGYRKIIDAVVAVGRNGCSTPLTNVEGNVGSAIRRLDGQDKVEGREAFGDDIAPADALVIKVIRSPFARAGFSFGDLEAFVSGHRGIEAVLTAVDVPGENRFGVIPEFVDQPVFAETEARYPGEAVAAVIGEPEIMDRFEVEDFPVTWRELSAVTDMESALSSDLLHKKRESNIMCGGLVRRGEADEALAKADVCVEGEFRTSFVEHAYIEPEAGYGYVKDGRVEIYACTQAPGSDLESLAIILAKNKEDIRIVPTGVGGGFGSKLDLSVQPFLALGAIKTGRPVRITYTRSESMRSTTKRHPSHIRLKMGADKNGRLSGFNFEGDFNTGAYASWGPTVANRVPVHASGPYLVKDYFARTRAIHTNGPPSGAFRGFGVPQTALAQEVLLDELAEKVGMDALDFRLLNALDNNEPNVCGQVFEQGVGIKACLEALRSAWTAERGAAEEFNRRAIAEKSPFRRGVGIASAWYGCGNTSLPNPSTIKAGVTAKGQIVLHQGAVDIGQGSNTVISQIFAEALGVLAGELVLVSADTDVTPDAGKTSASRQTFVSGNAARLSGAALRAEILQYCNADKGASIEFCKGMIKVSDEHQTHELDLADFDVDDENYVFRSEGTYDPPTQLLDENGQGEPYAQYGYAAQLAIVEVDLELGSVKALKFIAAHDVGRAINPALIEGQVQGGIAQGLGMALMEEYVPGQSENLHDYLIPTIGDIPAIETIIVEEADAHGPYGAKGLGEHVLIPTAPAICNAIRHACGVRVRQTPVTPSRMLQLLREGCMGSRLDCDASGY